MQVRINIEKHLPNQIFVEKNEATFYAPSYDVCNIFSRN